MTTRLKVGSLAERTGLTVRTLHHYDEIGLLRPAERTASGHRLYGPAEVSRLQRITSLRHLGLSLEEVSECLDRPGFDLDAVLALQAERLRDGIERAERLLDTLEMLRAQLRERGDLDIGQLTGAIRMTKTQEKYFTAEQRKRLARRAETVGVERMDAVGGEWQALFAAFSRALDDGLDPASPEVQILCGRYDALVAEFTGGDAEIAGSLREMFRGEGPDVIMAQAGMPAQPPGVWGYIARARAAPSK
jgi:DNA-binding transcriptional MerR regulator